MTVINIKELVSSADRLQAKVLELRRALQNASPHALIPPGAAFLLADACEEAFAMHSAIADYHDQNAKGPAA